MNSCSFETLVDKGRNSEGVGIINDTLAMVAVVYWEDWEDSRLGGGSRITETDWGLMLMNTHNGHIYSEERAGSMYKFRLGASPLEDSTMVSWDQSGNFWFWKSGYPKPKPVKVRWTTSDSISYELIRPWKDGKFLVIGRKDGTTYGILDTANGTIGKWIPTGDDVWLNGCVDARWDSAKREAICLIVGDDVHNLFVLKNLTDTLHISIPQDINISGCPSLQSKLIGRCSTESLWPQTIFFVDGNLQIRDRKPIYFPGGGVLFIDSLKNHIYPSYVRDSLGHKIR